MTTAAAGDAAIRPREAESRDKMWGFVLRTAAGFILSDSPGMSNNPSQMALASELALFCQPGMPAVQALES